MMNGTMSFFLRAKHWQLFLLLVVIPMVAETTAMVSLPMTTRSLKDFGRADFLFAGTTMLYMFCFLAWFWSLGSFLKFHCGTNAEAEDSLLSLCCHLSSHLSALVPGSILRPETWTLCSHIPPTPLRHVLPFLQRAIRIEEFDLGRDL
jgi:hypothetical protein